VINASSAFAVESRGGVQTLESLNLEQVLLRRCLVFGGHL
jgi:hypothetical protein